MRALFILLSILLIPQPVIADSCDVLLGKIKTMPFKGEPVNDQAYNSLMNQGVEALDCLVKQITNATPMEDPRKSIKFRGTTIGDIALFVILDIVPMEFKDFLPHEYTHKYEATMGVYAYFEYVENPKNREKLRSRIQALLEEAGLLTTK